jgi:hypothetical protein
MTTPSDLHGALYDHFGWRVRAAPIETGRGRLAETHEYFHRQLDDTTAGQPTSSDRVTHWRSSRVGAQPAPRAADRAAARGTRARSVASSCERSRLWFVTAKQRAAGQAFEAELRRLEQLGLTIDPTRAAELGRRAARWLATQEQSASPDNDLEPTEPTSSPLRFPGT